ncbi:MAG TPA: metal-sensitive transcriptional regulator [Tissierellales bacterium]|nr:metal-sensitive transcriptional regulator [Tissierellales bacterium]
MKSIDDVNKDAITKRLRRIEGQVKGIQKMVENDKYCGDVLIQVAAARSALNSVGGLILENYTKDCLKDYLDGSANEEALDALVNTILKYTKQN